MRYRYDAARRAVVAVGNEARQSVAHGPFVRGDLAGYCSPVTGRWIEGRRARRADLAVTACREVDPSERPRACPPLAASRRTPK